MCVRGGEHSGRCRVMRKNRSSARQAQQTAQQGSLAVHSTTQCVMKLQHHLTLARNTSPTRHSCAHTPLPSKITHHFQARSPKNTHEHAPVSPCCTDAPLPKRQLPCSMPPHWPNSLAPAPAPTQCATPRAAPTGPSPATAATQCATSHTTHTRPPARWPWPARAPAGAPA